MWLNLLIGVDERGQNLFLHTGEAYGGFPAETRTWTPKNVEPVVAIEGAGQIARPIQMSLGRSGDERHPLEEWLEALFPKADPVERNAAADAGEETIDAVSPDQSFVRLGYGEQESASSLSCAVPFLDADSAELSWLGVWCVVADGAFLLVEAPVAGVSLSFDQSESLLSRLYDVASDHRVQVQREAAAEFDYVVPSSEAFGHFMYALARQYEDVVTGLFTRHETWELGFFREGRGRDADESRRDDEERLLSIGEDGALVRRAVSQLMALRHPVWGWVHRGPPSGGELDAVALLSPLSDRLRQIRTEVRDSLDLIASRETGAQLDATKRAQEAEGRFQLIVTLATSLVLVPGLIASFWGADVWLPWRGDWKGTLLLLGLMALSAAGTLGVLLKVERDRMTLPQLVEYLKYELLALKRPEPETQREEQAGEPGA
jgi:hypothetical protein